MVINIVLIAVILLGVLLFLRFVFKTGEGKIAEAANRYDIPYLAKGIKEDVEAACSLNLSRLNISKGEMEKREFTRKNLRWAKKRSPYGDAGSRNFMLDYFKSLLQKKYHITPETITKSIPFHNADSLSYQDKFDILLYHYREHLGYKNKAFSEIMTRYHLDETKPNEQGIHQFLFTKEDLDAIFSWENIDLTFSDRLEILAVRIFSIDYGNAAVDDLIYQNIDGISGGCSGLTKEMEDLMMGNLDEGEVQKLSFTKDAVWIVYKGKATHVSCLSWGTSEELARVCKNICNYKAPGHFSAEVGFMVNRLKLESRSTSMRPPFTSDWVFWIRLFGSTERKEVKTLYPQKGNEILDRLLYFIIRGEQTNVISGPMGAGKTTIIQALVAFVNPTYTIRTIELVFELLLQRIYHWMNIAALCGTKSVSTDDALEVVRKAEADTIWFGEITKESEGEKVIKISQISKFTVSSIHTITTPATVSWFRNALVYAGFSDHIAEQQVVAALRFDIHLEKDDFSKERFVERITEIVPKAAPVWSPDPMEVIRQDIINRAEGGCYTVNNILEYKDGTYQIVNPISAPTCRSILKHLNPAEREEFKQLMGINDGYIYGEEEAS